MAVDQEVDHAFCHVQPMWQCGRLLMASSCSGLRLLHHAKQFIDSCISKGNYYEHWGCSWSHASVWPFRQLWC